MNTKWLQPPSKTHQRIKATIQVWIDHGLRFLELASSIHLGSPYHQARIEWGSI